MLHQLVRPAQANSGERRARRRAQAALTCAEAGRSAEVVIVLVAAADGNLGRRGAQMERAAPAPDRAGRRRATAHLTVPLPLASRPDNR